MTTTGVDDTLIPFIQMGALPVASAEKKAIGKFY